MRTRIVVAFAFVGIGAGAIIYRWTSDSTQRLSLRDALWVTDVNMTIFYPPHSLQSSAVIDVLVKQGLDSERERYSGFVLYRQGLRDTDSPNEPLLITGFQPPKQK